MKVFIAYRYTGEDPTVLRKTMEDICNTITAAGHSNSCSINNEALFREKQFTVKQIMEHALRELDQCDALLAFVNSSDKSEGLLIEVGYALAQGKPVILAKRKDAHAHSLAGVATQVIEFENLEDLLKQLNDLKLPL